METSQFSSSESILLEIANHIYDNELNKDSSPISKLLEVKVLIRRIAVLSGLKLSEIPQIFAHNSSANSRDSSTALFYQSLSLEEQLKAFGNLDLDIATDEKDNPVLSHEAQEGLLKFTKFFIKDRLNPKKLPEIINKVYHEVFVGKFYEELLKKNKQPTMETSHSITKGNTRPSDRTMIEVAKKAENYAKEFLSIILIRNDDYDAKKIEGFLSKLGKLYRETIKGIDTEFRVYDPTDIYIDEITSPIFLSASSSSKTYELIEQPIPCMLFDSEKKLREEGLLSGRTYIGNWLHNKKLNGNSSNNVENEISIKKVDTETIQDALKDGRNSIYFDQGVENDERAIKFLLGWLKRFEEANKEEMTVEMRELIEKSRELLEEIPGQLPDPIYSSSIFKPLNTLLRDAENFFLGIAHELGVGGEKVDKMYERNKEEGYIFEKIRWNSELKNCLFIPLITSVFKASLSHLPWNIPTLFFKTTKYTIGIYSFWSAPSLSRFLGGVFEFIAKTERTSNLLKRILSLEQPIYTKPFTIPLIRFGLESGMEYFINPSSWRRQLARKTTIIGSSAIGAYLTNKVIDSGKKHMPSKYKSLALLPKRRSQFSHCNVNALLNSRSQINHLKLH